MGFEWDPQKARENLRKHGVQFSTEAIGVFEDDLAITIPDFESDALEERFICLGMGAKGRILVVVFCYREENIRIISARPAEPLERAQYAEEI